MVIWLLVAFIVLLWGLLIYQRLWYEARFRKLVDQNVMLKLKVDELEKRWPSP